MRAVVIEGPGAVEVRDVADPAPGPGQVVLRVDHCGVCGTDVHVLDGAFAPARYPVIPGHEICGEVVALGREVAELREGDLVVVDPSGECGRCEHCREARPNLCVEFGGPGLTRDGGCAEYVVVDAAKAYRLPEGVDPRVATLAEPLSCALRGMDRLPQRMGSSYLVYGAGTMGALLAQLARHAGASSVAVVETSEPRRHRALQLGADAVAASADELDRAAWDIVIDASGAPRAIEDALRRVRRGGTYLQCGVAPAEATVPFTPARVAADELTIVGSMGIRGTFGRALALLARDDVIDAGAMVTHRLGLDDYTEAIGLLRSGDGLKIQVAPTVAEVS